MKNRTAFSGFLATALLAAPAAAFRFAPDMAADWKGERGAVFAADSGLLVFEGDAEREPVAELRRAPDAPPERVALLPAGGAAGRWLLELPEEGWYDVHLAAAGGDGAEDRFAAAVVGRPVPEEWRGRSVFGIWTVHGDPALVRLAGARWNRRMTAFHSVTRSEAEQFGGLEPDWHHAEFAEGAEGARPAPYDERDGLRQVGVFSFGLPMWTMDIPEGVKKPSFGSLFHPATNWNDVARCVAAYARTHELPRDFSIYNEPLAHFKGKPAQIADYARAVRAGLKAADPSFRVGGPGLYSIRIRDLSAIEEGGLLESLDFLDLHAYVGGTPPEDEFVRKIDMLRDWLRDRGRPDMPIYLTEFGWTAAEGTWQPPVDRATQARYVARSLALAWSRRVDALVYFALDFRNKKAGEAAFSLVGPDGRPEAGYAAFAAVSRHFAASEPIGHAVLAPGVHMVAGKRCGCIQIALWCDDETFPFRASLPIPALSARDLFGSPLPAADTLAVSQSPVFLEIGGDAGFDELSSLLSASLPPPDAIRKRDRQPPPPPLDIWPEGRAPRNPQDGAARWKTFGEARGGNGASPGNDCTAHLRLSHSAEALTVEVAVADDEHCQSNASDDASQIWAQDSIQLGIDIDFGKPWEAGFAGAGSSQTLGGHRVFEFSVGGSGDGPGVAYLERSWDDALPAGTVRHAVDARVVRDEAAARTLYRVRIPWSQLGAAGRPPRPGEAIGLAIAVNDVDPARGAARHGLALFGGIVHDKEPKNFGPALIH